MLRSCVEHSAGRCRTCASHRLVVAIIGLAFTPGVPYMAPNYDVRREKPHAEIPRRASPVAGQNLSRGRREEQLPLTETSPQSWILGREMNSSFGGR
jgi:hypothetical protein